MLKRIFNRLLRRKSPEKSEMEYLLKNGLTIGKNVRCYSDFWFDSEWPWLISVGDNSMISTNVKILAHDASTSFLGCGTKIGRVDIGVNCFIGSGSIVLCGVSIGDNSIIGAGSVVTKDVEANSVYAGNPAKYICSISELKDKHMTGDGYFDEYSWDKWKYAPLEDKLKMKEKLKGKCGYVR